MLVLKFKRRGYKKEVEIESKNFRGIYYELGMLLNPSESSFEEDRYILSDEDYDKDFYMYLLATGKVEIDFNDRLYTEDYNLYKQLEIELEDE